MQTERQDSIRLLASPKRRRSSLQQVAYKYYASFSERFVVDSLSLLSDRDSVVFDPWNGAGTSTAIAARMGFQSRGIDLNPAMVLVAAARLAQPSQRESALGLLGAVKDRTPDAADPLLDWFDEQSVTVIRRTERTARMRLNESELFGNSECPVRESDTEVAAAYCVMFVALRSLTDRFASSNPTWIKRPVSDERMRISAKQLRDAIGSASATVFADRGAVRQYPILLCHSWPSSSVPQQSVDFVVTSPPYLTRIDYVVASRIELALLRVSSLQAREMRDAMLGTPTVWWTDNNMAPPASWGRTAREVVERVAAHSSKSSKSYYLKTIMQYFYRLHQSIVGISDTLRVGGHGLIVVQASQYKDILLDLPAIVCEMLDGSQLGVMNSFDFPNSTSLRSINPRARSYGQTIVRSERVLAFERT